VDGVRIRDFRAADRDWVVHTHGRLYREERGYDESFETLVGEIVDAFVDDQDPRRERGWIAERAGDPLGCIFCTGDESAIARLRLFLVTPDARGLGLGKALIARCIAFAQGSGYARMKLWTHSGLTAAVALYARNGFEVTDEWPSTSFGVEVTEQTWERAL
jgi:GNAT superfamily N-acetyltransferase